MPSPKIIGLEGQHKEPLFSHSESESLHKRKNAIASRLRPIGNQEDLEGLVRKLQFTGRFSPEGDKSGEKPNAEKFLLTLLELAEKELREWDVKNIQSLQEICLRILQSTRRISDEGKNIEDNLT